MSKILVVDDNATNLTLFRHLLLKVDGVEVECRAEPAQALAWCADHEPDLILLDYMMPQMDGLEFIRRLFERPDRREVPVVMVTADTENGVRHQALELGAQDFLTKPVDKAELMARVRNLLALRTSRRQLTNHAAWLAGEVCAATARIVAREKEAVLRLSRAAEYRDCDTGAHLLRLSGYVELIARRLGLPDADVELMRDAAPMHDVGKVGIPDYILLKPGKLTAEEFEIMKRHPQIGYDILCDSESPLLRCAASLALNHHERFDGSGYPHGTAGEDIPLEGRIVAVADVFDALSTERPYKKPWELADAAAYLKRESASHFDPRCVDAFLSAWPEVLLIRERFRDAGGDGHGAVARVAVLDAAS